MPGRSYGLKRLKERIIEVFGEGKYEIVDDSEYVNYKTPLKIKCLTCGDVFTRSPEGLFKRMECPCQEYEKYGKTHTMNKRVFIMKTIEKYGENAFGYDKVEYRGNSERVQIWCPNCKEYVWVIPSVFLGSGKFGCPKCAVRITSEAKRFTTERWLEDVRRIRDDWDDFDYSQTVYTGDSNRVKIFCRKHGGYFEQLPREHLLSIYGCPICARHQKMSFGERCIHECLEEHGIFHIQEQTINDVIEGKNSNLVRIDFTLEYNGIPVWIEYNGKQHYADIPQYSKDDEEWLVKQVKRDRNVEAYCREQGIKLIVIPYTFNTKEEIWDAVEKTLIQGIPQESFIKIPEIDFTPWKKKIKLNTTRNS